MLLQNFFFGMVTYSQAFYLPLFMENARRLSPLITACLMLAIYGTQAISSIASGQYISRFERYGEVIWSGFFLWTLGIGLTCIFSLNTPLWTIAAVLAVQGMGSGSVFQPVLVALQAHCAKAHRAIVISNRNFIRSLGGAVGLAISAAALQNSLRKAMPAEFHALALSSYETPPFESLDDKQTLLILQAHVKASRTVFMTNVPFMVLCLAGCIFIKDRGLVRPGEEKEIELSNSIETRGDEEECQSDCR